MHGLTEFVLVPWPKRHRWSFVLFSTDTKATFANSAEKRVLNLFWPPCVMNINEVCMDWFYGIYKPANQIYGDLQTSRILMGSNGTR